MLILEMTGSIFGLSNYIILDNETHLVYDKFEKFCKIQGTVHKTRSHNPAEWGR